jgi:ABC-type transport system involved in multi-copper enzyme maturation permease subunit
MATSIAEPRWYHIGPHGFYDLARRGRSTLVRVAYVLALFAALAVGYYQAHEPDYRLPRMRFHRDESPAERRQESINTNARIAERFSITILIMQNLAVLLLMPIYVAASVQEERDTRTLPILFTTDLSAGEIIRGKWLARVGHVGSILLGGLPILCFVQLWGGIDMPMIAANFCNTACWLCSVAAFSLMMATRSRSMVGSLVKSYVGLGIAIGCVSCSCVPFGFEGGSVLLLLPFAARTDGYMLMGSLAGVLALIHLNGAQAFLLLAARNLDAQRGEDATQELAPESAVADPFDFHTKRRRSDDLPEIWENAIAWKERYRNASPLLEFGLPLLLLFFVIYFLIVCSVMMWGLRHAPNPPAKENISFFVPAILVSFGAYILLVAFRMAGSVAREVEQQTLDSLLTLPISRTEILDGKWMGILLRYRLWQLCFAISWPALILFGGAPHIGLFLFGTLLVHLYFFGMLGAFLSVVCRTIVFAYVWLSFVMTFLVIGTLFIPWLLNSQSNQELWLRGLNPVGCWITINVDWWLNDTFTSPVEVVGGVAGYALAGFLLQILACACFARR